MGGRTPSGSGSGRVVVTSGTGQGLAWGPWRRSALTRSSGCGSGWAGGWACCPRRWWAARSRSQLTWDRMRLTGSVSASSMPTTCSGGDATTMTDDSRVGQLRRSMDEWYRGGKLLAQRTEDDGLPLFGSQPFAGDCRLHLVIAEGDTLKMGETTNIRCGAPVALPPDTFVWITARYGTL